MGGVDRVNEFIGNVSGSGDAENDTMMNGTDMANDTIAEMPEEMAGDDGRRKLMEMMEDMANATDAIGEMNMTMNATDAMNMTDDAMNATMPEEMAGDDGRRLMDVLSGVRRLAMLQ